MKNNDEMYRSLLSRWDEYQEKKKKRICTLKRSVPVLACLCLTVFLCIGYWKHSGTPPVAPPQPGSSGGIVTDVTGTTASSATVTTASAQTGSSTAPATVTSTVSAAGTGTSPGSSTGMTSARVQSTSTHPAHTGPVTTSAETAPASSIAEETTVTTTKVEQQGPGILHTGSEVSTTTTQSYQKPTLMPTIRLCTSYYDQDKADEAQYTKMNINEVVEIKTDYNQASSSWSGIGILFEFDSPNYFITLYANTGNFLWWDIKSGSGPIVYLGNTYDVGNKDSVFWAPYLMTNGEYTSCIIEIGGTDGNHGVSLGKVVITENSDHTFSAVLKGNNDP